MSATIARRRKIRCRTRVGAKMPWRIANTVIIPNVTRDLGIHRNLMEIIGPFPLGLEFGGGYRAVNGFVGWAYRNFGNSLARASPFAMPATLPRTGSSGISLFNVARG